MSASFNLLSQLLARQFQQLDVKRSQRANAAWRQICPPGLLNHTEILAFEGSILSVYADSPLWGNAVMHQKTSLQQSLESHGIEIRELRVRVIPRRQQESSHHKSTRQANSIQPKAAKLLRQTAENVKHDALRANLIRLSEHAN